MHSCCHGNIHYTYHLILSKLFVPLVVLVWLLEANWLICKNMQNLENLDVFESSFTEKLLKCPKDPFVRAALKCRTIKWISGKSIYSKYFHQMSQSQSADQSMPLWGREHFWKWSCQFGLYCRGCLWVFLPNCFEMWSLTSDEKPLDVVFLLIVFRFWNVTIGSIPGEKFLPLVLLKPSLSFFENTIDPDQLASEVFWNL